MSNKKHSVSKVNAPEKYKVKNALVNYYLVLMFSVFPLFFTQQFSSIRHDKLYLFLVLSIMLIFIEFVILLCSVAENRSKGKLKEEKWYRQLSLTDYAFGALILCYIISTLLSSYPADSFSGSQGRNSGLFLFIIYFLVYIIISRLLHFKEYVFVVLCAGCSIVFVLCVLNYFYFDPLGMFIGYSDSIAADFTSTIGNKNIMSCFCCITVPVLMMFFMNTKSKIFRYFYLVSAGLGFSAMLCADSESGFLGFVPVLALILLYYIRNVNKLRDFFIAVSVMLVCAKALRIFSFAVGDTDKGFGAMQTLLIYNNFTFIWLAVTILLAVALFFIDREKPGLNLPKSVFIGLLCVYLVIAFGFIFAFIYFTFINTQTKLGTVLSVFRFNEKWGTHRGYMWIKSWEIFKSAGIKDMIFGCGPDTFYSAFSPYFGELYERFGDSSTNCAHNEFLNYLITTGVLGLAAYLALFVSAIVNAVKTAKINPLSVVFISSVVCYLIQSIVNIATPITTPLLFIFLSLSQGICRQIRHNEVSV